jgi:gliding motility-associated-like protein
VVITGNTSQVELSFSGDVTEGALSVTGRNVCGTGSPSPEYRIIVGSLPAIPGEIRGDVEICAEDGGLFSVQPVDNATSYIWNYDGPGADIAGNENKVLIRFSESETSGNLTVYATNQCGSGEPSPPLAIRAASCNFFIPNAFSPNNDGVNDRFVIRNLNNTSKLIIFDRSGKIVFETADYQNNWDGSDIDGKMLPTDTYWYVLTIEGFDKELKGFIYLKR